MVQHNETNNMINHLTHKLRALSTSLVLIAIMYSGATTANEADRESFKVHGDWVVTVINPDGSVAQERRFRNALTGSGQSLLTSLLVGAQATSVDGFTTINQRGGGIPAWHIEAIATGVVNTPECMEHLVSDNPGGSELLDADVSGFSGQSFSLTRDLALPASCISGSSYSINTLRSAFPGRVAQGGTLFAAYLSFSEKALTQPITGVLPDQVVTLKVMFSFE